MGIEDIIEMVVEHITLETLHFHGFLLEDLDAGVEEFVRRNRVAVVSMLKEENHWEV